MSSHRQPNLRAVTALASVSLLTLVAGCANESRTAGSDTIRLRTPSVYLPVSSHMADSYSKTDQGKDATYDQVSGPTGTLTRRVGQREDNADFMLLSADDDVDVLTKTQVAASTSRGSTPWGVSVVALTVRKGNPKKIRSIEDLTRKGLRIVSTDPQTAGSGRWNVAGLYAAGYQRTKSQAKALAFTNSILNNVTTWKSTTSTAHKAFADGEGDVLLTSEAQAIADHSKSADLPYVVPPTTLQIDYPWAVLKGARKPAVEYLNYIRSDGGQQVLANYGFRGGPAGAKPSTTVDGAMDKNTPYAPIKKVVTVKELGGWTKVQNLLFDGPKALFHVR